MIEYKLRPFWVKVWVQNQLFKYVFSPPECWIFTSWESRCAPFASPVRRACPKYRDGPKRPRIYIRCRSVFLLGVTRWRRTSRASRNTSSPTFVCNTVDGSEILPVEFGSLSHHLQGFIHPRWFSRGISEPSTVPFQNFI